VVIAVEQCIEVDQDVVRSVFDGGDTGVVDRGLQHARLDHPLTTMLRVQGETAWGEHQGWEQEHGGTASLDSGGRIAGEHRPWMI